MDSCPRESVEVTLRVETSSKQVGRAAELRDQLYLLEAFLSDPADWKQLQWMIHTRCKLLLDGVTPNPEYSGTDTFDPTVQAFLDRIESEIADITRQRGVVQCARSTPEAAQVGCVLFTVTESGCADAVGRSAPVVKRNSSQGFYNHDRCPCDATIQTMAARVLLCSKCAMSGVPQCDDLWEEMTGFPTPVVLESANSLWHMLVNALEWNIYEATVAMQHPQGEPGPPPFLISARQLQLSKQLLEQLDTIVSNPQFQPQD